MLVNFWFDAHIIEPLTMTWFFWSSIRERTYFIFKKLVQFGFDRKL